MRAALRVIAMLFAVPLVLAWTEPRLSDLPPPVRDYGVALTPYCEAIG